MATIASVPAITNEPLAGAAVVDESLYTKGLNEAELVALASSRNGVNVHLALKIAKCESNLRQYNDSGTVLRGRQNAADVGIFQINERYHLKRSRDLGYNIYDPADNVEYAMYLITEDGSRHWKASQKCWAK